MVSEVREAILQTLRPNDEDVWMTARDLEEYTSYSYDSISTTLTEM